LNSHNYNTDSNPLFPSSPDEVSTSYTVYEEKKALINILALLTTYFREVKFDRGVIRMKYYRS